MFPIRVTWWCWKRSGQKRQEVRCGHSLVDMCQIDISYRLHSLSTHFTYGHSMVKRSEICTCEHLIYSVMQHMGILLLNILYLVIYHLKFLIRFALFLRGKHCSTKSLKLLQMSESVFQLCLSHMDYDIIYKNFFAQTRLRLQTMLWLYGIVAMYSLVITFMTLSEIWYLEAEVEKKNSPV